MSRIKGIALVGVALVVGVIVFLLVGTRSSSKPACDDGAARLDGVWDDAARAELGEVFAASEMPYSDKLATSVNAGLDAYAGAWKAAHLETCKAGDAARARCLDRRLAALEATVDVLDADAVERSLRVVDALPPLACPDRPAPADVDRFTELDAQRAVGAALVAAGRHGDAIAALSKLADEARAFGDLALESEVLLALGSAQAAADGQGARETLFAAVRAAQAAGHTEIVADAAIKLAGRSVFLADWRDAEIWLGLADASVTASGDAPLRRAAYESAAFARAWSRRDDDDARTHAEKVVERLIAAGANRTPAYADALVNVGAVLGRLGRRDDALVELRAALALREELLGETHPDVASTHQSIAVLEEGFDHHAEALAGYEKAYEITLASSGAESLLAAGYLDHIAGAMSRLGKGDEALTRRLEALAIREAQLPKTSTELADSYANLGTLLLSMDRLADAERRLQQALSAATSAYGAERVEVAAIWRSLADVAIARQDWVGALDREAQAIAAFEAARGKDAPEIAYPLTGVGLALLSSGKPLEAIPPLDRAITIAETAKLPELPRARFFLAQARLATGDRAGARDAAERAKSEYLAAGKTERAEEVSKWLKQL